ncbi:hypothetical protein FA10DRAFT_262297 [Acaromyces ingoldii]|uniref:Retrograde transport protein Dsl1 C-terminal domain-containing protein n=1 Tax=Acaromyces ingoldii TaxID=215250 RepID=A0A316YFJ3_9BASI|nr:hypothetical protein FA10DRAFT_262297 [Acaromyces ingoldii]PWN87846.1 hypothetical protein FA10DRAFT_262297 [Acaromyces ingoldii]
MAAESSGSLGAGLASKQIPAAQDSGYDEALVSLFGSINAGVEAPQGGATSDASAPPKLPLSSQISLLSAHIDALESSMLDSVRSDAARSQIEMHIKQARKLDTRMTTAQCCLKNLHEQRPGNYEIDARVTNVFSTARREHLEAQAAHVVARKLLLAVRALENLEDLVQRGCMEAQTLIGALDAANATAAHFGIDFDGHRQMFEEDVRAQKSDVSSSENLTWGFRGNAAPSLSLRELTGRLEQARESIKDQIDEVWRKSVHVDCSDGAKRVTIAIDVANAQGKTVPLAVLCKLLESRSELEPRLVRLSALLLEKVVGPMLEPVRGSTSTFHGTLNQHGYLSSGIPDEEENGHEEEDALYHASRLVRWADNVQSRFIKLIADDVRSTARSLLVSEDNRGGGWEASQVEIEAEVDLPLATALEQQRPAQREFEGEEAEIEGMIDTDSTWKWEDRGERPIASSPASESPWTPSPTTHASTQPSSLKKGKGKLGGVRVVKPQDQLGSGPLPHEEEAADDAMWGFDDEAMPSTTNVQGSPALQPSTGLKLTTAMPAPNDDDVAWFAEEDEEPAPLEASPSIPVAYTDNIAASTPDASAAAHITARPSSSKGDWRDEEDEYGEEDVDEDAWGLSAEEKQERAAKRASRIVSIPPPPVAAVEVSFVDKSSALSEVQPEQQGGSTVDHSDSEEEPRVVAAEYWKNDDRTTKEPATVQKAFQDQTMASVEEVQNLHNPRPEPKTHDDLLSLPREGDIVDRTRSTPTFASAMPIGTSLGSHAPIADVATLAEDFDEEDEFDAWGLSLEEQAALQAKRASMIGKFAGLSNEDVAIDNASSEKFVAATSAASGARSNPKEQILQHMEDISAGTPSATLVPAPELSQDSPTAAALNVGPNDDQTPDKNQQQQYQERLEAVSKTSVRPEAASTTASTTAISSSSPETNDQEGTPSDPSGGVDTQSIPTSLTATFNGGNDGDGVGKDPLLKEDCSTDLVTPALTLTNAPQQKDDRGDSDSPHVAPGEEWSWKDDEDDRVAASTSLLPLSNAPAPLVPRSRSGDGPISIAAASTKAARESTRSPLGKSKSPRGNGEMTASPKLREATLRSTSLSSSSPPPTVSKGARKDDNLPSSGRPSSVDAPKKPFSATSPRPATPQQPHIKTELCTISRRSLDLIRLCNRLLEDFLQLSSEEPDLDATPLILPLTDIIDLHRALMPVSHADTLTNVPSLAMQFANDCLYIAKELAKIRQRLGLQSNRFQKLVDLERQEKLTMLVGRRSFDAQMLIQEKALKDCLLDAQGFTRTHEKDRFAACQRCIKQVLFTLQQLSKAWKGILAPSTYLAAMGNLVDGLLSQVLHAIIGLDDISEEESEKLAELVRSLGAVEGLFKEEEGSQGAQTVVAIFVPSWFKASYLGEILTGSLIDIEFLYFEADALVDYGKGEIVKLIKSLFADTPKRKRLIDKIETSH